MNIKTVAYKGSKRKLLSNIEHFAEEMGARTVFDGFSGSGIVSAYLRTKGYHIEANDVSVSSALFGRVFLNGFDQLEVDKHIEIMNNLTPTSGWLTENYSGERTRKVRGKQQEEVRPLAFQKKNAEKLDAARDYVETLLVSETTKDALIFAIILAANRAMNISNDQKSSLKKWSNNSLKDVIFHSPSNVTGIKGTQHNGDIFTVKNSYDLVYLDPPYCSGVLYPACYHINDSLVIWDKPELNSDYALPRPQRAIFDDGKLLDFFSKKTANEVFDKLISNFSSSKRIVLSYSDAPRNSISLSNLEKICKKYGDLKILTRKHKLCTQPNSLNKISDELNEYFFVLDTKIK